MIEFMEQYINKSAVVAEIEKLEKALKNACKTEPFGYVEECMTAAELQALDDVKDIIDALEVKEVDLEEEVDKWYNNEAPKEFENVLYRDIEKFAKYFFELGLKAKDS